MKTPTVSDIIIRILQYLEGEDILFLITLMKTSTPDLIIISSLISFLL